MSETLNLAALRLATPEVEGDVARKHHPSKERTRIYLVRHGRTRLNAAGVLRGHLDPGLDAVGVFQAKSLGDVIGRMDLQLIVSSPLRRAVETARAIAVRAGLEVEIDLRLIDRDYGPWAGKTRGEVVAQWGAVNAAPDMEPEPDVLKRGLDAVESAVRRVPGGSVVVVSHDVVNRLLLPFIDPRLQIIDALPQDTGCFNVIEKLGDNWSVLSVNNTPAGHEPPLGQTTGSGQGPEAAGDSRIEDVGYG